MKVKRILRFYFSADSLERAFDNIILKSAVNLAEGSTRHSAERICGLICEKQELGRLWNYIDGVVGSIPEEDIKSLKLYAGMRYSICRADEEVRKCVKRAVVKFMRRARRLESFNCALGLVGKYYRLIAP